MSVAILQAEELQRRGVSLARPKKDWSKTKVRTCAKCRERKPLTLFPVEKKVSTKGEAYKRPGRWCKACRAEQARAKRSPKQEDVRWGVHRKSVIANQNHMSAEQKRRFERNKAMFYADYGAVQAWGRGGCTSSPYQQGYTPAGEDLV